MVGKGWQDPPEVAEPALGHPQQGRRAVGGVRQHLDRDQGQGVRCVLKCFILYDYLKQYQVLIV